MYLDTSVAVAIYAREPASDALEAVLMSGDGFISSELLRAELAGALLAKGKSGVISVELCQGIMERFERQIHEGDVQLIPLNNLLITEAVELMRLVYPEVLLRTLDALHLATFMSVEAGPLFTRDKRMLAAARRLGIPLAE